MKKIILSIFCFTYTILANAQSPSFQWAKNIGGYSGTAKGNSIAKDNADNIYTTGTFAGRVDFDLGPAVNNLNSSGGNDVFILKTDAASNLIWIDQIGGTSNDNSVFITLDGSGNIFITGTFSGTVDFNPGPGIFNLTSAGGLDAFILKLDASGNFLWAKQLAGTADDACNALTFDASGNIHMTGTFSGTTDFDPGPGVNNITSNNADAFILKLDALGNFVWAKKIGGGGSEYGWAIALDASGNIYTGGRFSFTVDFDPGAGTFNLSGWAEDAFVLKLDASGNFAWAVQWGGSSDDDVRSIVTDASGNLYITGSFFGQSDFDPGAGLFVLAASGHDAYISKLDAGGNLIWAKSLGGDESISMCRDASGNLYTTNYYSGIIISKLDASGNFIWTKTVSGPSGDGNNSILVDASGNVVTTGYFIGTVDFDPGAAVYNLTTIGDIAHRGFFILKLNSSGNFVWAKNTGSGAGCNGYSVTVDMSGNVITTGNFYGKVDFDPGAGFSYLVTDSINQGDVFVSKLNSSGNFLWAKQFVGISNVSDEGKSVTTDAAGNIYVTGTFRGTSDFDPGPGSFNLTASGMKDIFICKLDPSGNFVWARNFSGAFDDVATSIKVDGSGNVYTTGYFSVTTDFDPGPGTYNLTAATSSWSDIFICKLNASGNFVWAYKIGGSDYDAGYSITLDGSGNVYTTGYFKNTVDFDPGPGTFNLVGSGSNRDIFISKTDGAGNFIWAKQMSGPLHEDAFSIAVDVASNVYTTGTFNSTVDFDPGPGTFNMTATTGQQIFVSKLDASGNFVWAKQLAGGSTGYGNSIAVDGVGSVYTTGHFYATSDFDPGPGTFNLIATYWDVFISKLDASGNFVWAKQIAGSSNDFGNSIAVDGSGNVYTTGVFYATADFDEEAGVFNITPVGEPDMFIHKMSQQCVPPAATSVPSGSTIVCRNTTGNTYTVPSVGGATSYIWTAPTGATISSGQGTTSVSINFGSTAVSGNICVYASNTCGNSSTSCKAVTVVTANPTTPTSITGTTLPCANSNGVPYSCTLMSNASSYNWTVPATATIASGQGTNSITVNFGSTFTSGSIKVQSVNCYGVSSFKSLTVRGKPSTPGVITGQSTAVCAGTNSVPYSIPATTGATTYNWTAPLNATIASGQGTTSVTVNYSGTFTSGTLSVTAGNTCGSSAARTLAISSLSATPGTMTGQVTGVCAGTNGVPYSIAAVSGASSYLWTAPPNATIASGQGTTAVTVNYGAAFTTGTLSVKSVNACGTSGARNVTIRSVPVTPGTITGAASVCANQTAVPFSIAAVTGATTYNWTVPAGATVASGQGTTSITVNFGTTAGSVKVQSGNACGYSTFKSKTVSITCKAGESDQKIDGITFFPNPFTNEFTFISENDISVLNIYDASGRLVEVHENILTGQEIKCGAALSGGIYFAEITYADERKIVKLIKEN